MEAKVYAVVGNVLKLVYTGFDHIEFMVRSEHAQFVVLKTRQSEIKTFYKDGDDYLNEDVGIRQWMLDDDDVVVWRNKATNWQ